MKWSVLSGGCFELIEGWEVIVWLSFVNWGVIVWVLLFIGLTGDY